MIRTPFAALLLAFAAALPAGAKDLRVAADGSGDYKTLLPALRAAAPGDIVVIKKAGGMVGLQLGKDGANFVVKAAVPGSPAEAAGIKAGERIVAVDGEDLSDLSLDQAVAHIKGPVGSNVILKVSDADGANPRKVPIVRGDTRWPVKDEAEKIGIARSEKDDAAAFELATTLAKTGVPAAESALAFDYYYGTGASKDPKSAARWAQLAAKDGDASAQRLLAAMYAAGTGVEKNAELSVRWSLAGAEKGDSIAMGNVALSYSTGWGAAKDEKSALEWARRAVAPSATQTPENIARIRNIIPRLERDLGVQPAPEPREHFTIDEPEPAAKDNK
ncbi:MAG: PDZ domain-containing protein [Elusimicrobiota bacterium]